MLKISSILIWVVGAALAAACSKSSEQREAKAGRSEPERASTTGGEGMTPSSGTRSATEQIADALCGREERCGKFGGDAKYSSWQDCRTRIQSDWRDDLNARKCPGGVNQQQLDECVAQIRAEACGNPFDTLARVTECTSGQICVEEPQR